MRDGRMMSMTPLAQPHRRIKRRPLMHPRQHRRRSRHRRSGVPAEEDLFQRPLGGTRTDRAPPGFRLTRRGRVALPPRPDATGTDAAADVPTRDAIVRAVVGREGKPGGGTGAEEGIGRRARFTGVVGAVARTARALRVGADAAFAAAGGAGAFGEEIDAAAGDEVVGAVGAEHGYGEALDEADVHGALATAPVAFVQCASERCARATADVHSAGPAGRECPDGAVASLSRRRVASNRGFEAEIDVGAAEFDVHVARNGGTGPACITSSAAVGSRYAVTIPVAIAIAVTFGCLRDHWLLHRRCIHDYGGSGRLRIVYLPVVAAAAAVMMVLAKYGQRVGE